MSTTELPPDIRAAAEAIGRSTKGLRESHNHCDTGGCPWSMFWDEDAQELAVALHTAGYTVSLIPGEGR